MTDHGGPIFLFGSGQRTGSTLVQRLLSSHPDVLIWGEHAGQLSKVFHAGAVLEAWSSRAGAMSRDEWQAAGQNGFIANLTPVEEDILDAVRCLVTRLFASPARAAGKHRWGFKEVRYGAVEALFLQRLFPSARLVHIVRDPRDMLRSLDHWERERPDIWSRDQTEAAVRSWLHVSETLLQLKNEEPTFVLSLRYEDLLARPDRTIGDLAGHLGLEVEYLDRSVLDHKVHQEGVGREAARLVRSWLDLPADLKELLRQERIRRTALAFGYEL